MGYNKEACSNRELIERLKNKGFSIDYDSLVDDFISNEGYYHILPYIKCFMTKINGKSQVEKDNINFNNVIKLYEIDTRLHHVLYAALKQIEIFLKSTFIKYTLDKYKDPMWHTQGKYIAMNNRNLWIEILNEIQEDRKESDVVKFFFERHPDCSYLPIRILVEITSFGPLTKMFSYLSMDILRDISEFFQVNTYFKGTFKMYNVSQLKGRLRGVAKLRNRIVHSEITWSVSPLPLIQLPNISKQLNTTCSYIQLIKHFLDIIPNYYDEDKFYKECFLILKEIEDTEGITEREKIRIGIVGNRESRFKSIL